jgi:hypothetical protein
VDDPKAVIDENDLPLCIEYTLMQRLIKARAADWAHVLDRCSLVTDVRDACHRNPTRSTDARHVAQMPDKKESPVRSSLRRPVLYHTADHGGFGVFAMQVKRSQSPVRIYLAMILGDQDDRSASEWKGSGMELVNALPWGTDPGCSWT